MYLSIIISFCLALIMLQPVYCEKSMYVVWGQPDIWGNIATMNNKTWDECVNLCLSMNDCVLASNQANFGGTLNYGCIIFSYYYLGRVISLDSKTAQGSKVAFKIDTDNSSICPSGKNAPLFENTKIEVALNNPLVPSAQPKYDIESSGVYWLFNYTSIVPLCGSTLWSLTYRPAGALCETYYIAPSGANLSLVNAGCDYYGGKIAGVENSLEQSSIIRTYQQAFNTSALNELVILLDGSRKPECQGSNWKTNSGCDSFNAFNYLDPYNTQSDGYIWEEGAPFGMNCLAMWVKSESNPKRIGTVRDIDCNQACLSTFCIAGTTCWKLPSK